MKKTIMSLLCTALFVGCADKGPHTIAGTIIDATMNTLMVVCGTDTLSFSTLDAERIAPQGILIGDSAIVTFAGKIDKNNPETTYNASKIVVSRSPIVGGWVQPIGVFDGVQGMQLEADGSASSINMATLLYNKWMVANDSLYLCGQSVGNGQTIDFNEAWHIDRLTADSLIISNNNIMQHYSRQR